MCAASPPVVTGFARSVEVTKSMDGHYSGSKGVVSPSLLRKTRKLPNPAGVRRKLWKANRKVREWFWVPI
jgi:hypothetical protein